VRGGGGSGEGLSRPRATPPAAHGVGGRGSAWQNGGDLRPACGAGWIRAGIGAAPQPFPAARATAGSPGSLPGTLSAPGRVQQPRPAYPPPGVPAGVPKPCAHLPSDRSASSSGLGARRPMLAGRERLSPSSSFPAASPPPPPPAPAAPESALLRWAARLLRSAREPRNPSAGAYVRPWLRSRPPASFPPSASRPAPGAGPADPSVQPRPLPESKREEPQRPPACPPAPPIRRSASYKHKLSQAPPRSR
jgi:hypothetical protein